MSLKGNAVADSSIRTWLVKLSLVKLSLPCKAPPLSPTCWGHVTFPLCNPVAVLVNQASS